MKGLGVATVAIVLIAFTFMILPAHAQAPGGIGGTVFWADQYGNLHPFSWVQIRATDRNGAVTPTTSTVDGTYMLWLSPGTYNVTASSDPAFLPQTKMVVVTSGGVAGGVDFTLQPSGNPIPEYPSFLLPMVLVVTMLVAMVIIRHQTPRTAGKNISRF